MPSEINAIKKNLSELARQENKRDVSFGQEEPHKWWTGSVIDPRSGEPFTPSGAWDFIAEQLEKEGTLVKEVLLKKPLGKLAYAFCVGTGDGTIYIKVRLAKDKIIGRSFHYVREGKDYE